MVLLWHKKINLFIFFYFTSKMKPDRLIHTFSKMHVKLTVENKQFELSEITGILAKLWDKTIETGNEWGAW